MLKQLKHAVSSAISIDALKDDFKLDEATAIKSGRHNMFILYQAIDRMSEKRVTVFVLPLRELAARCGSVHEMAEVMEAVRHGVALLAQLRHPHILRLERPLVEEKKRMWFVTECVTDVVALLPLSEMPAQLKLLELRHCGEAMRFVHERADTLVGNFTPQSIFVTEGGGWKVGDFIFAKRRAELSSASPVMAPHRFRGLGAPQLDYMPYEYVNRVLAKSNDKMNSLFDVAESPAPLVFPDSDVFAFVLVTVEVVTGKRLFQCLGDPAQQPRQRREVEATVVSCFPGTNVLHLPRPPMSFILSSGPYATPDLQVLVSLEGYETMEANERFRVLQGVYNGLGGGLFCEAVVVRTIIPLMKRESRQPSMMRFVLPVMLQCAATLTDRAFDAHLREYFVSLTTAIVKASSMDKTDVLAQQILEKMGAFEKHLMATKDQNTLIMPFVLKCLSSSGNTNVLRLALGALQTMLLRNSSAADGGPPSASSTRGARLVVPPYVAETLVQLSSKPGNFFDPAFDCLELVLAASSLAVREATEGPLLRALNQVVTDDASASQALRIIKVLQTIQTDLSPEHLALTTIPSICPLLLNRNRIIRVYAVRSVQQCLSKFENDGGGGAGGYFVARPSDMPALHVDPVQTSTSEGAPLNMWPSAPAMTSTANDDDLLAAFGLQ